jgi:preprotein translocase subunit SecA
MDYTRSSVNLRAYGQRDPLVEYKKEGLRLFKEMGAAMSGQIIRVLPNIVPIVNGQPVASKNSSAGREANQLKEVHENAQIIGAGDGSAGGQSSGGQSSGGQSSGGVSQKPEVGRNDPCPCGSGKKYKKCHGAGI